MSDAMVTGRPVLPRWRLLGRHQALPTIAVAAFAGVNIALQVRQMPTLGGDFRAPVYDASRALLDGRNPYPAAGQDFHHVAAVVVMPIVLLLVAPLTLLPQDAAVAVWLAVLAAAALATIAVLRLDRTHLLLWLTGAPVVIAFLEGNSTLLVALALALAWRFRDHAAAAGAGVAAAAVLKLWPIAFIAWLWLSGRRRAAVYAAAITAVAVIGGWALIGFRGLSGYPAMVSDMSGDLAQYGSWLIAWLISLGVAYRTAAAAGILAAAALIVCAARSTVDSTRFTLAAAAGITATATSWLHYMCILVLPTEGAAWLLLPALWVPVRVGEWWGRPDQAAATLTVVGLWAAARTAAARR